MITVSNKIITKEEYKSGFEDSLHTHYIVEIHNGFIVQGHSGHFDDRTDAYNHHPNANVFCKREYNKYVTFMRNSI